MTEDETIALAVACNLGRTMTPLGMNTGEVFATDQSYRTAELFAFADAVRAAERERMLSTLTRHDKGAGGFYDTHEPAEIIRALSSNAIVSGLPPTKG